MTIRSTIALLVVPLFIGLALVNGALLYVQTRAETAAALNDQAKSAAVTVAEFVREMEKPAQELTEPVRAKALHRAMRKIVDLENLDLVEADGTVVPIKLGRTAWKPPTHNATGTIQVYLSGAKQGSHQSVIALAPAGAGRTIAARFSAETTHHHMARLVRNIVVIALVFAALASALTLLVSRRITREVAINRRRFEGESLADEPVFADDLQIREARDLADAVRLFLAGQSAAAKRQNNALAQIECGNDLGAAIRETQARLFAPIAFKHGTRAIAMRLCGDVCAGSFFACATSENGGTMVVGRCRQDNDLKSLAAALDVRRLIEQCRKSSDVDRVLAQLGMLYRFDSLERADWQPDTSGVSQLLVVAEPVSSGRIGAWCQASSALAPEMVLANLDIMLRPDAIVALAAIEPSTDSRKCAVGVRFDREDRAESADVEDLANGRGQT